ncbi:hypothetical protein CL628_01905 [bacterium]|nr:hypothetical protein [bacterium]
MNLQVADSIVEEVVADVDEQGQSTWMTKLVQLMSNGEAPVLNLRMVVFVGRMVEKSTDQGGAVHICLFAVECIRRSLPDQELPQVDDMSEPAEMLWHTDLEARSPKLAQMLTLLVSRTDDVEGTLEALASVLREIDSQLALV